MNSESKLIITQTHFHVEGEQGNFEEMLTLLFSTIEAVMDGVVNTANDDATTKYLKDTIYDAVNQASSNILERFYPDHTTGQMSIEEYIILADRIVDEELKLKKDVNPQAYLDAVAEVAKIKMRMQQGYSQNRAQRRRQQREDTKNGIIQIRPDKKNPKASTSNFGIGEQPSLLANRGPTGPIAKKNNGGAEVKPIILHAQDDKGNSGGNEPARGTNPGNNDDSKKKTEVPTDDKP